ncbi:hypothetical protein PVIIG_05659 [Plasmodium vivax India VII]|uniref:Variable surface protein Vir4 n=1 Tax=Plasmodium vivax India VII TaxID=1077284 RepID=A0A0J9S3F8_PLAVI|nr:hypothetical protein PVIIG_05659 [Plasmodium vivax India VII]
MFIICNITRKSMLLGISSKDFNSEQFYDKLYQDDDNLSEYYSECKQLTTPYMSNYKGIMLRIMCATLVKYLKTAYISLDRRNLAYNDCILLNYWVYTRLANIFGSDDPADIAPPFAILQQIWNGIIDSSSDKSRNNICKPDNSIATQKDWRKRKELYDYYVNYDQIEKYRQLYKDMCPKYWTYVDSHTSLYEYFEKHCKNPKYDCPNFYKDCKKYDPRDVLRTFGCNEKMEQKKVEDTIAKAKLELQEGRSANQEQISGIPGSSEVSAGGSLLTRDSTHPAKKTGDILLGVVATSLASGALYRVNISSLIHIYRIILFLIILYYIA